MERRKIHNYIDKKIVRPFLVCGIVLSPFIMSGHSVSKLTTPPTVNSKSFSPESFQTNYLFQPILVETISTKNPKIDLEKFHLTDIVLKGIAGNYSREGCLGCSKDMTMSNGEPLDDTQLTLAAPKIIPLNSPVLITNTANDRTIIAKVTDRGGFDVYGRIADFTPAVKTAIGGETDLMDVEITVLEAADSTPSNP